MGLADVRPYFRDSLETLGYVEHEDAFNVENIGSNILNGRFHLETGLVATGPAPHLTHEFLYPITVRIFRKGFRNVWEAYNAIDADAQSIYEVVLDTANRLTKFGDPVNIKDIIPESYIPLAFDESNDNAIILEMVFSARLELCFTAEI